MKYFLIFAYGSLVNFESAEKTLHRKLIQSEITQAWATGYERVWDYTATVFSDTVQKDVSAVFLNLKPNPVAKVNGLVFRVNEDELGRLKNREANYTLVDITATLDYVSNDTVFAFICSDNAVLAHSKPDCYVMEKYIELVKKGFCDQGNTFYEDYLRTTTPFNFEVVKGNYSFLK